MNCVCSLYSSLQGLTTTTKNDVLIADRGIFRHLLSRFVRVSHNIVTLVAVVWEAIPPRRPADTKQFLLLLLLQACILLCDDVPNRKWILVTYSLLNSPIRGKTTTHPGSLPKITDMRGRTSESQQAKAKYQRKWFLKESMLFVK